MFFIISCFCLVINVAVVKFFWPSNQKVKREQKMCCCVLSSNIKIKNKLLITYGIHIFGMEIFNVLLLNLFFRFFLLFLASLFFLFYIKFKRIFFSLPFFLFIKQSFLLIKFFIISCVCMSV